MKKAALIKGDELTPISATFGTLLGSGVVSIRAVWLNL